MLSKTHPTLKLRSTRFETDLQVRPDDIDMNQHVHSSRYQDYVLAARFDQMARCYQMSMDEFHKSGWGWFVKSFRIDYKRPLGLGEWFTVRTWIEEFFKDGVQVRFEILKKPGGKLSCQGASHYTLVSLATGRAQPIPDWVAAKYAV